LHDRVFLQQTATMPGAEALLDYLIVNGLMAGIVTNKGQERAETQLRHLGWLDKVAVVVGYVPGKPAKPSPRPVKLACKLMQIDVRRSLFIGDGPADMQAASRAGSLPVGIADSFSEEELRESGAALCFANLMDIQAWLQQQIA
jgi:pyrophosphatase PpaX